jgi:ParB-like chromosome segregation protein Spo0J
MDVEMHSIAMLKTDARNLRRHGKKNIEAIASSLKRWGQQRPILIDSSRVVRCGNGTLEAARLLGWTEIACITTDLTGPELSAYAIADNRTAELAEWSSELSAALGDIMTDIPDLDIGGLGLDDLLEDKPRAQQLKTLDVSKPPKMAWVLIGVPLAHWPQVSGFAETAAQIEGSIVETTVNDNGR